MTHAAGRHSAAIDAYVVETLTAELTYLEDAAARNPFRKLIDGLASAGGALAHWPRLRKHPASARADAGSPGSLALKARGLGTMALGPAAYAAMARSEGSRILIDMTHTHRVPKASGGIPRVVRELSKAAVETELGFPVYIKKGALHSSFAHPQMPGPIAIRPGDTYFIADVFWYFLREYDVVIDHVLARGGRLAVLLHDIFPFTFPSFSPAELPPLFTRGVLDFLSRADTCLSLTRSGEEEIKAYLNAIGFAAPDRLHFRHFPLAVTERPRPISGVRRAIATLFASPNVFLSVGTLEPRKGYSIALKACDIAWASGAAFSYCIIGRYGWRAKALRAQIERHPEFGRRLFWFSDVNDAELDQAYAGCRCLIQASVAEGFGLPLIEASKRGASVAASDIPVFHEIGGDQFNYFPVADPQALAEAMIQALDRPRRVANLATLSWADSMQALHRCLAR